MTDVLEELPPDAHARQRRKHVWTAASVLALLTLVASGISWLWFSCVNLGAVVVIGPAFRGSIPYSVTRIAAGRARFVWALWSVPPNFNPPPGRVCVVQRATLSGRVFSFRTAGNQCNLRVAPSRISIPGWERVSYRPSDPLPLSQPTPFLATYGPAGFMILTRDSSPPPALAVPTRRTFRRASQAGPDR